MIRALSRRAALAGAVAASWLASIGPFRPTRAAPPPEPPITSADVFRIEVCGDVARLFRNGRPYGQPVTVESGQIIGAAIRADGAQLVARRLEGSA